MLSNIYSKFRRITSNHLYFPEIDGIRFLAIMLVIIYHAYGYFLGKSGMHFTDAPTDHPLIDTFLLSGDRGVQLFFVLSGFVLCLPFAQQYLKQGKEVQLKKYYLRRLTRLEPPYFIAMTAFFVLQAAIHIHPLRELLPSWLASLAYSHNAIFHRVPLLTVVAWSLEIEIQFYILAPMLFRLLVLPPLARRGILLTATFLLIAAQQYYEPPFLNIYLFAQYFFVGILLADFHVCNSYARFFEKKWLLLPALVVLIAIVYLPIKNGSAPQPWLFISRLALPLLIAVFYYGILKNNPLKQIFSYKFIPIIGGMCYSIYLLHYAIISFAGRLFVGLRISSAFLPNVLLFICLVCIPVLLISSLFYYFVERPFMSSKWLDILMQKGKKVQK